jgi:hypothetical protein
MHCGESGSGICLGARYKVTLKKDSCLIAPNQKASGKEPKSLGGFPFKSPGGTLSWPSQEGYGYVEGLPGDLIAWKLK